MTHNNMYLISLVHLDIKGTKVRRVSKGNLDGLPFSLDLQALMDAQGPWVHQGLKEHGQSISKELQVGEDGPAKQASKAQEVIMAPVSAPM